MLGAANWVCAEYLRCCRLAVVAAAAVEAGEPRPAFIAALFPPAASAVDGGSGEAPPARARAAMARRPRPRGSSAGGAQVGRRRPCSIPASALPAWWLRRRRRRPSRRPCYLTGSESSGCGGLCAKLRLPLRGLRRGAAAVLRWRCPLSKRPLLASYKSAV